MKTITIGITAADFAGNKGAAAMLQTIIKNVMREKDNVEFKLFSVYPYEDRIQNPYENLEVISCKPEEIIFIAFPLSVLYSLLGFIKPIKDMILKNRILSGIDECDFIVDAAGISFVDSRGLIMNTYNFICAATPLLMKKEVYKFSQAMGPIRGVVNRFLAKLVLPKLSKIIARGQYTYDYLKELELSNVEIGADGAFNMLDLDEASEYVEQLTVNDDFYKKDVIGVSISSVVFKYCNKVGIDYIGVMLKFIKYLQKKGYGVLIIANAARKGNDKHKNNDLIVCNKVYKRIRNKELCRWYDDEFAPEIIRELISQCRILVASRFHAMIGALEKETPVLLIGWSHKYEEVLDMFHIGEYAIDYKKMNYDDLVAAFEKLDSSYGNVRQQLKDNISDVKRSSYKSIEMIINKVNQMEETNGEY